MLRSLLPGAFLLSLAVVSLSCKPPTPARPNVLFIAVDDLRPELGSYGASHMVTPHMDRLAAEGRVFLRHYVQVPTCGASRYALLTGTRPHTSDHINNNVFRNLVQRTETKQPETFAHLFKRQGYYTAAVGKISHHPDSRLYTYEGEGDGALELPFSWDEATGPVGKWGTAWNAFFGYADGSNRNMERGAYPAYERAAVPDTSYPDGLIAEAALKKLRALRDRPFFLAVGFFKPHLPFTAPEPYWALYDDTEISLSPTPEAPARVPAQSLHASSEMFRNYGSHSSSGGAGVVIDAAHARTLRHAYYANVSFVDAQVGKLLDELDRLGLAENTIVVLWGDHGWHLGDHTIWGKHTTFERSLHSVLMMRTPSMVKAPEALKAGMPAQGLVETLDIYPTLAELAGLVPPPGLTGSSLVPLLNDPSHPGKDAAFGYWRGRKTMRTNAFRIVAHDDGQVELYDHRDGMGLESVNIADEHPEIVQALLEQLRADRPRMLME